jgi:agmatine deiminase
MRHGVEKSRRLPAEWEEQDGVLLAWPHGRTDWGPLLAEVEPVYLELATNITAFEELLLVVPEGVALEPKLRQAGVRTERLRAFPIPTNDTWARDFGPITICEGGICALLDFGFNGWGLKFAADLDNQVTRRLREEGAFGRTTLRTVGFILEGGSVESDGRGTVLTTSECLLGPNRNPHLDRRGVEEVLREHLGARRVLWLEHGHLAGDDTDAHVDTLVRFAPEDRLLYVACEDEQDEHFETLARMKEEVCGLRTEDGRPYRLTPLPWPTPRYAKCGRRLPATYANFLVLNGAVLVPTYRDPADPVALECVREAFPDREVLGVDCLPLLYQHGSLHCVTMQLPKGVLAARESGA